MASSGQGLGAPRAKPRLHLGQLPALRSMGPRAARPELRHGLGTGSSKGRLGSPTCVTRFPVFFVLSITDWASFKSAFFWWGDSFQGTYRLHCVKKQLFTKRLLGAVMDPLRIQAMIMTTAYFWGAALFRFSCSLAWLLCCMVA